MSNVKKEEITCIWCIRGLTRICEHDNDKDQEEASALAPDNSVGISSPGNPNVAESNSDDSPEHSLPELPTIISYKTDASLKDQQSTGRKRAAKLYPLNPDAYCEWSGKTNQGGGSHPINGCGIRPNSSIGLQQCRHHGPDKNTLNNEVGNVHRICTPCHNEWHAKNDKDYIPGNVIGD